MKKIISLVALLVFFCQAQAAEAKRNASLLLSVGHTWPVNGQMDAVTGGKASFNLSGEYEIAGFGPQSYFSILLGLKFGKLPFNGERIYYAVAPSGLKVITSDWDWTVLTPYTKVLIDKNKKPLVPYAKFGLGLYHLDIEYDPETYLGEISKSYLGYVFGFGVEYNFGRFAFVAELEDNIAPRTNLKLLDHEVRNSHFLNPQIGFSFKF